MIRIAALRSTFAAMIPALVLLACATSPAGNVDFDSSHNFDGYQSFAWLSENPMKVGQTIVQPRETLQPTIMTAIRSRLESQGFRYKGDAGAADFLVAFTVGSREKITRDAYPSMSSAQAGRWGWGTAYYGGTASASYTQGVLAIDVFDAAEERPVWHGVAGRAIAEEDRDNIAEVVEALVASILAEFPPG